MPPALMRALDLLQPYLAETDRILDESTSDGDLRRLLFLPDTIEYVRGGPNGTGRADGTGRVDGADIGPRTLVMAVMGPDRNAQGGTDDVASILARLKTGSRAVILFGWD